MMSKHGGAEPSTSRAARPPVTSRDEPDLPSTEPELRAQHLGFALRRLAAELVAERQKVAELRRQVAELKALLESQQTAQRGDGVRSQ